MRRNGLLIAVLLVTLGSLAWADKLDDFKEAVKHDGCRSIPYSDQRNICTTQQSDVHSWCDGHRGVVKCDDGATRKLKVAQNDAYVAHTASVERRRELEAKRSGASDDAEKARLTVEIEQVDRVIEAAARRMEDLRNDVSKRRDHVEKVMTTINKCVDYRQAVMNVFAYATDKVRGETDDDVKPYSQILRDKYSAQIGTHKTEIEDKFISLERCKQEMP